MESVKQTVGSEAGAKKESDDNGTVAKAAKQAAVEAAQPGVMTNLDFILDIPLEVTVELGRTKKKINELLRLGPGAVVELNQLDGEPLDILANKQLIARGTVVVEKEKYGIRITEILSRRQRLDWLR
jgi:flagellar motor switch protein FliN